MLRGMRLSSFRALAIAGCLLALCGTAAVAQQSSPLAIAEPTAPSESAPVIAVQIEPPPLSTAPIAGSPGPLGVQSVADKPIVAEVLTENHQSLKGGNRITRSSTSVIYRDAQGRVRRESQLLLPGLPAGVAAKFITIIDRGLGCGWVLDPQAMTAHRYRIGGASYVARLNAQGSGAQLLPVPPDAKQPPDSGASATAVAGAESRRWRRSHEFSTQPLGLAPETPERMNSAPADGQSAPAQVNHNAASATKRFDQPLAASAVRTESLGEQMILGFRAHGTRVITTVPAGQIGNESPIDIVSELWFSPELELVMRSLHRDPWGGEFVTMVTKVRRRNQPADLFKVPAQYTMIDADTENERHVLEGRGNNIAGGW